MKKINEVYLKTERPERVIQFGEGGFLRGFVDWMFQKLNDKGLLRAGVVVVQPIEKGLCSKLMEQDCIYTHVMRGLDNGKPTVDKAVINVISRCVEPYSDYEAYLALADNPDSRFIVQTQPNQESHTTKETN